MKDVVLIPAWRRPEFLWHCLANIKRAEGAADLHYIFRFDHGHSPELHEIIKDFPFSHEVAVTRRVPYLVAKQSYSLLTGYAYAAAKTNALVFMIEEDVMVATDFFRWHYEAQAQNPDAFCTIAVANPNRKVIDTGGHDEYYRSSADYCSLGVCFRKDMLLQYVLPAVTERYYVNPIEFCARNFPNSPFGQAFAEQDGLIRRLQWRYEALFPIVWPWQAKAYHAGLYGKNRGAGPSGTLAKRLQYVTDVIYSEEAMRSFAKHPEWFEDSRPINLNAQPWTALTYKPLDPERNPARF